MTSDAKNPASKHTPGTWEIERDGFNRRIGSRFNDGDGWCFTPVAKAYGNAGSQATTEGNAHLIAASPELLAACKQFIGWMSAPSCLEDQDEALLAIEAMARIAVAKAEGSKQ